MRRGRGQRRREEGGKKARKEEKENEMGKSKEMRKGLTSSFDAISLLNMFCIKSSFMDSWCTKVRHKRFTGSAELRVDLGKQQRTR